jgi:flavin-dependent dehydrogenase
VFRFERTFNPGYPYAFQVKRAEFDELLFRHAAANGVDAREGVRISELAFDAGGVSARGTAADGTVLEVRARYLVDATGRDTLLGAKLGLKRKHAKHQSAALFAHFRGVTRRSGEDEGNISVYRFEHGWVWMIPLRDGLMSVGAVCRPEYLKQRRGRNAEFLLETLRAIPAAWARMERAEIADHLHVTGNYSYECRELAGRRWIMVGDAFAFVDPIFSSGVFLAMNSAEHAARLIHEVLDAPQRERALQREYARTQRRGVHEFSWFIYRFTAPPMRHLFANPRNVWGVEQAMISMLAGDVFDNGGVRRRLRLFKVLYYLRALAMLPQALRSWFDRRRQLREAFAGGTTSQDHG